MPILLLGALLAAGGLWLIILGGSSYYLIAGVGLMIAGFWTYRLRVGGLIGYIVVFAATVIWAFIDAGFQFWPLFARTFAPLVFAVAALFLMPILLPADAKAARRASVMSGIVLLVAAGLIGFAATKPHGTIRNAVPLTPGDGTAATIAAGGEWRAYGRTNLATRYAPFDQINAGNVSQLKVAWTARHGDISRLGNEDQNTPLYADGLLYHCSPTNIVTAINGSNGKIVWRFDPKAKSPFWNRCRTLAYSTGTADTCGPRIILATIDGRLMALGARDGKLCPSFGKNGTVDLREGMGEVAPGFYMATTGPILANGKIVIGGWVADNVSVGEPSGVIRGFDELTGALSWAWDSGNPAITALPPPGQTYTRGTPNSWTAMSADAGLGLVYVAMGNATPDYWGGERRPSDDAVSSSVVALDLGNGKVRWKYQTVHHDLWDYDLPSQPVLVDLPSAQGVLPALVQLTKRGQIFLLDRRTGRPLAGVEERPVPAGNATGERYAPSQPYSVGMPAIGAEPLSEARTWGITPLDHLYCRIQFKRHVYQGDFTPPQDRLYLQYPNNYGGFNWGSASFDEGRNLLIVNDLRMAASARLMPRKEIDAMPGIDPHGTYSKMAGTPFGFYITNFLSPLGIPCTQPPFGTITAIDMVTRKIVWQRPLGTPRESGPFGLRTGIPLNVGMPTLGGSVATKGGLVFISGTQDYFLRAIDARTGKVVWKGALPTGGQSTPMTYLDPNGRQFVVVNAGGAPHNPHDRGDYIVAFALPPHDQQR
ncbi:membrane-bound PQQ-dependent dehydrogenase, glucose/quinate/shikimate family [Novosphingobium sp. BL-8H]|uniref:membrane-bound PQQ-dependent dehydrogenase, glucose/quinate/shikimate family n=1 Tax=Novosphingobium sp. BL-8H TaxID=3127640 RepID=UPI0037583225